MASTARVAADYAVRQERRLHVLELKVKALHEEREPRVQVALLQAFAEVATQEGAAVVRPLLDASGAEVRIAALKALLELDYLPAELQKTIRERIGGYASPEEFIVEKLVEGIATLAAAFAPNRAIVRQLNAQQDAL